MADPKQRLDTNVQGNFFVDATCINCDTCRQLAPDSFQEVGEYSAVVIQPVGDEGQRSDKTRLQQAMSSFPLLIEGGVFYCGFNSEKSFGANSYFIRHTDGNWLVDSPRYVKHLVDALERMGGLRYIVLTHEDDVADAARYAARFGATRIIHRADAEAMPDAEWIVDGSNSIPLAPQFTLIPVPGHTPGSSALLYDQRFLFTGDHLWWDPKTRSLQAPQRLVWRSRAMVQSLEKLLGDQFEWVLPGHGDRIKLTPEEMRHQLRLLVDHRLAALAS
jgi:glyoxylase-like metal-dependent hydrolase (beta-lactamase superfamily II)/ferredoxin